MSDFGQTLASRRQKRATVHRGRRDAPRRSRLRGRARDGPSSRVRETSAAAGAQRDERAGGRTDEDDGRGQVVGDAEQLAHQLRPVAEVLLDQLRPHNCGPQRRARSNHAGMRQPLGERGGGHAPRRKVADVELATALASSVFPVPGSPYRITPLGGLMPMSSYLPAGSGLCQASRKRSLNKFAQLGVGQGQLNSLLDLLNLVLQPADVRVRLQRRLLHLVGGGRVSERERIGRGVDPTSLPFARVPSSQTRAGPPRR